MGWHSTDYVRAQEKLRHRNRSGPREARIKDTPGYKGTGRDRRGLLEPKRFCFET